MKKWAQYLILGLLCISLFITTFYIYKDVSNLRNMLEKTHENFLELESAIIDMKHEIDDFYDKLEHSQNKKIAFEEISEHFKSDINEISLTDADLYKEIKFFYSAKKTLIDSFIYEYKDKLDEKTLSNLISLQNRIDKFWEKISDYKTDNELLSAEITEKYCNAVEYSDNNFVIPSGQAAFVCWYDNIIIPEHNDSFKVTRTYEINDKAKPGYLIVEKNESRYMIIINSQA